VLYVKSSCQVWNEISVPEVFLYYKYLCYKTCVLFYKVYEPLPPLQYEIQKVLTENILVKHFT